jgi:hypothetical protein
MISADKLRGYYNEAAGPLASLAGGCAFKLMTWSDIFASDKKFHGN